MARPKASKRRFRIGSKLAGDPQMSTMREAVSCTLAMLSSASGAMARQASAWAGTKISRLQPLYLVQGGEAGLHVDEEGDMML